MGEIGGDRLDDVDDEDDDDEDVDDEVEEDRSALLVELATVARLCTIDSISFILDLTPLLTVFC